MLATDFALQGPVVPTIFLDKFLIYSVATAGLRSLVLQLREKGEVLGKLGLHSDATPHLAEPSWSAPRSASASPSALPSPVQSSPSLSLPAHASSSHFPEGH